MAEEKKKKTWQSTSVQNLMRHWRGTYYARLRVGGNERWKSLRTKVFEVAKNRLRDEQREAAKVVTEAKPSKAGRMTMGMALAQVISEAKARLPLRRKGRKTVITESSGFYREQTVQMLRKSWQETVKTDLDSLEVRKIPVADVRLWADKLRLKVSSTRFNNTLGSFRRAFDIAVAAGELHHNPTFDIARSYKAHKESYVVKREDFPKVIAQIRSSISRLAEDIGDFVEFLAYTGARKDEAAHVRISDVDLQNECVTFRKTKNGRVRTIDLIPEAVDLIKRIWERRGNPNASESLLRVTQAYGSMRAAAKALGLPRFGHQELRDLFATTAIESSVDIPTVADWLGHLDGGKLMLERYRKHRPEHAKRAAKKVSFAENIQKREDEGTSR